MRISIPFLLILLGWPALTVAEEGDEALITRGDVRVMRSDVEAELAGLAPEERRGLLASDERLSKTIDKIFVYRVLAQEAQAAGLDADPVVRRQLALAREAALGKARLAQIRAQAERTMPPLSPLARETFDADPARFKRPETVEAAHILILARGRSPEELEERVTRVHGLAASGERPFDALAKEFSDEPLGAEGQPKRYRFTAGQGGEIAAAVLELREVGDLSAPVRSPKGYHLFRLARREAARQRSFEEVKDEILLALRAQRINRAVKDHLDAIRTGRPIETHTEAIHRLR